MAPIEFEKQVKEHLEERRIKPSEKAWKKVAAEIRSEPGRRKSAYLPYAVAATLVGVLLATVWILKDSDKPGLDGMPLVEQPASNASMSEPGTTTEIVPSLTVEQTVQEEAAADSQTNFEGTVNKDKELVLQTQESSSPKDLPKNSNDVLVDVKISEVVAQVKLLEDNEEAVTDAEVDALLRTAQQEILADRKLQAADNMDSAELLAGVEDELEKSFRDQVFEKLNQGYIKVKTAVADRNK